ncbi:hypothetical protein TNCV_1803471 [Trichonephila clavipes]|uniref:Uncharacterized protein n=1 Tax=Trichonephila clavipes TaxID=2585209 RepID=A0A8X6SS78_TRICX|nr:hypothetical protein TNCV_1803471 [Trichonephila clavipes]
MDEDSNHLRREEREAILREKKKSFVCEELAELLYERIRRRTQFRNTAQSVASTEEMKRLDQCLEDSMKHMGYLYEVLKIFQPIGERNTVSFSKRIDQERISTLSKKIAQGNLTASCKRLISWFLLFKATELDRKIFPVRHPKF